MAAGSTLLVMLIDPCAVVLTIAASRRASLSRTALPLSNPLDQCHNRLSKFMIIYLGKGAHHANSGGAFQKP